MGFITTCCFCVSLRKGCFAFGCFSLAFYTILLTTGAFHVNSATSSPALFVLNVLMIVFSGVCVVSSVFLLIGICVDSQQMLIPWIVCVFTTTLLDILFSLFLINDIKEAEEVVSTPLSSGFIYAVDVLACMTNLYAILCVYSQYQEYSAGRGSADFDRHPKANVTTFVVVKQKPDEKATDNTEEKAMDKKTDKKEKLAAIREKDSLKVHLEVPGVTSESSSSCASDSVYDEIVTGSYHSRQTTLTLLDCCNGAQGVSVLPLSTSIPAILAKDAPVIVVLYEDNETCSKKFDV